MKARLLMLGVIGVGLATAGGMADDERNGNTNTPPQSRTSAGSADEATIRALGDTFTKAFNGGDAATIARMHAPDAQVVDLAGDVITGREEIEREYKGLFEDNPGLTIEVRVNSVRTIGADLAIEEGTTKVTPKEGGPSVTNRYSAVNVKRDGQWLLASVRESPCEASAREKLSELAWLIGDWVDETSDAAVESKYRWVDDKQAILREFKIWSRGKVVMTGTQRIGWDPRSEQIKSWEFDSEGGHGEGLWARLGDDWMIKATAVLQDGRTATATHVIGREDEFSCRWRTFDRTIGGHVVPTLTEFVMVHPAPRGQAK